MWVVLSLLSACGTPEPPADEGLSVSEVAQYLGKDCDDPEGWASDLRNALKAIDKPVDEEHVCTVVAIIEQESSYEADPAVPGLGTIARREMEAGLSLLGPLAENGVDFLLKPVPEGASMSFSDRLEKVRTEQQLDRFFRDLARHYSGPASAVPFATEILEAKFEKLNPVTTAGSMQVSVSWAQAAAKSEGIPRRTVRDLLYTRAGGLRWGVARLFVHEADYDDPIYRFADFNAGQYASRNAEFQTQLSTVMDLKLAADGDLLAYKKNGRSQEGETMGALLAWRSLHAPDIPERQIRRDVGKEKEQRFESTLTWERLRASFQEKSGEAPGYARLPNVELDSPKMSKSRSTAWFAKNVKRRYTACLERDGDG